MFKKILLVLIVVSFWGFSKTNTYAVSCSCTGADRVAFSDCETINLRPVCARGFCVCTSSPLLPSPQPTPTLAPNKCECGAGYVIRSTCANSNATCVNLNTCFCVNNTLVPTSAPFPSPTSTPPVAATKSIDPFCTSEGFGASTHYPKIRTAVGCVPITWSGLVYWLLPLVFYTIGGITFLIMVYGFILVITSQGDPKALQAAKDTITSAIFGLLFSIFSLFILRLIVVGILKIPG